MKTSEQFIITFQQEVEELLDVIEETLLNLEQSPEDKESINHLFRAFHTIKGSGAMFGFDYLAGFSHHLENILSKVREGELPMTGKLVNLIMAARDHIRATLFAKDDEKDAVFENGGKIIAGLENLVAGKRMKNKRSIRFSPDMDIFSTGTDPILLFRELYVLGECHINARTENIPMLDRLDPEKCYLSWDITLTTACRDNIIRDVFIFVEEKSRIHIESADKPEKEEPPPANSAPELSEKLESPPEILPPGFRQKFSIEQTSVRVPSEKLDELVNLVGELVVNQARLNRASADSGEIRLANPVKESERLVGKLRECTLKMRMLPIGTIFGKFKRLVRELSIELKKEVRLVTEGAETEMDKAVIEGLGEPLMHLIRNAVDHGIEPPEQREKSGKPREGTLKLTAVHKGSHVMITVQCDGRGIDTELVRKKAVEKGLISHDLELSQKEVLQLIFEPGFSTAKQITSVSGRGVGLDVVKQSIESMGGIIRVKTHKGRGTDFMISLPLTLAIIDGLLVAVDRIRYILPLGPVIRCAEVKTSQFASTSNNRNMISVAGELIPFIRLRDVFYVPSEKPSSEDIIVVWAEQNKVGIIVDEIIGTYQTLIKSLGNIYKNTEGFSGATIMGDGTVALILDMPGLIRRACDF